MATITDQTCDRNYQELYRLAKLYPLPEYVKQASAEDLHNPENYKNLPSSAFADSQNRRFPVASKADCYLSWLHFVEKRASMPAALAQRIEERLRQYSRYHGIQGDIEQLLAKSAELHGDSLDALPDSAFALVYVDAEGRKERQYPLRNTLEVKAAAEWLVKYRDALPFAERHAIASKILEKAAEYGAALGDELGRAIQQQAGRGICDPQEVAAMIRNRVKMARKLDPAFRVQMEKLAEATEKTPTIALDPDTLASLCATIDQFDMMTGIAKKRGPAIPYPEEVLFKILYDDLGDLVDSSVELPTGAIYDIRQLAALDPDAVSKWLGTDAADAVTPGLDVDAKKLGKIAESLSFSDACLLERLLEEAGQKPLFRRPKARSVLEASGAA